jgi:hypothetical protein
MKRTVIGAAIAFAFAVTGCGSDAATNPIAPGNVAPDGSAEQQPPADAAEQHYDPPWGGQAFE